MMIGGTSASRKKRVSTSKFNDPDINDFGDNFALAVEPTDPSSEYATGADFDSAAPEVTDWYVRRDEDGNEVSYDYQLGEYTDEIPVVPAPEDAPWVDQDEGARPGTAKGGAE